ncbi:tyrosine-protein phosphatase [Streptococcus danieliae]
MGMDYYVQQIRPHCFQFKRETVEQNSEQVAIFLLDKPDGVPTQFLMKTDQNEFELELEIATRPYFLVESASRSYVVAERTLPVEGMNNFRDMGGYCGLNGKRVKWGKLYRSDHLHNATNRGIQYIKDLEISTVIDYRSENEISKYPNPDLDFIKQSYHLDPSAHVAELAAQFDSSKDQEDLALIQEIMRQKGRGELVNHSEVIAAQYQMFVMGDEARESFGKMIQLLADSGGSPFVQHCRGGKDRTGFGSALVLGLLGVSTEDIINDYLITGKNREERNRVKMEGYRQLTQDPNILEHLYSFIDTKPEFIEAALTVIKDKYGTIENYVLSELDISLETIERLRDLYLE